jgi:hypothetical protein
MFISLLASKCMEHGRKFYFALIMVWRQLTEGTYSSMRLGPDIHVVILLEIPEEKAFQSFGTNRNYTIDGADEKQMTIGLGYVHYIGRRHTAAER